MNAYQVLGEDYVRSTTYGLTGEALAKKRAELTKEAREKIAPLKKNLSPKVYEGFVKDGYTADQMLEYMAWESEKKAAKAKAEAEKKYAEDVEKEKKYYLNEYGADKTTGSYVDSLEGSTKPIGKDVAFKQEIQKDDFFRRAVLGAKSARASLGSVAHYVFGSEGERLNAEIAGFKEAKEQIDTIFKKKHLSEAEFKKREALQHAIGKAGGTTDKLLATLKSVGYDFAHPEAWDVAGFVTETMFDPSTYVGGKAASTVAKTIGESSTKKVIAGTAAGGATDAATSGAYIYADERGAGKSKEEAKDAALASAVIGAGTGMAVGAATSSSARILQKVKEVETAETEVPRAEVKLPPELTDSKLLEVDDVKETRNTPSPHIPTLQSLKDDISKVESRGSYTAKNPKSTAYGKYQFLKSTYEEASKALGKSVEELRTPQGQELAMEWLIAKNAKQLKAKGIEATSFNVYGAHQQGVTGFSRILAGKPTPKDIKNMYDNTPKKYRTGNVRDDWMKFWQSKFKEEKSNNIEYETEQRSPLQETDDLRGIEKAYTDSDARAAKIAEIEAVKLDSQTREQKIQEVAPASLEEMTVSAILNEGETVSHRMAGNELARKLEVTIAKSNESVDSVRAKLHSEGVRGAHLEKAVEAYTRRDMGVYEDYAAKKLRDSMRKVNNVNARDKGGDTAGEINRGDSVITGIRETATQDTQPTDIQGLVGEYTQAEPNARLDVGRSGTQDAVPEGTVTVEGHPTLRADDTSVSRRGRNDLVQNQDGVVLEPTIGRLEADGYTKDITDMADAVDVALDDVSFKSVGDAKMADVDAVEGITQNIENEFRPIEHVDREKVIGDNVGGALRTGAKSTESLNQRPATFNGGIAQENIDVKNITTRDQLIQHRYYDDVVKYAIGSYERESLRPKRATVNAKRAELEKRGLDQSDDIYKTEMQKLFKKQSKEDTGFHRYSKKEVVRIESGNINRPLAKKLRDDLKEYAANPKYAQDRELTDSGFRAFSNEAEMLTRMKLDDALDVVQSDEYVRGVDGEIDFFDVSAQMDAAISRFNDEMDGERSKLFKLINDDEIKLDVNQEKILSQMNDPIKRDRARRDMEREVLSGDALKAWEERNLDSKGNIREVGEC